MTELKTKYGRLSGVYQYDTYFDGQPHEVELREENIIVTDYGTLVPQFSEEEDPFGRQKKYRSSMVFHENGELKSIALEEQTMITTPIGEYPAELVTFYDDGSINRVFPLNGKINGYWSEEDEGKRAKAYDFDFEFGVFSSKLISLRFYPTGELHSLTLWPDAMISLKTPVGLMEVRTGFSMYKSGKLKSVEPAKPKAIHTEIGSFLAYDADALGLHADSGSIGFTEAGEISRLTTATNGIRVIQSEGMVVKIEPREVDSYVDITEKVIQPLKIMFKNDEVVIDNGIRQKFALTSNTFNVYVSELCLRAGCTDCSSCDACG